MTTSNIEHFYANSSNVNTALAKIRTLLNQPQRTLIGLTGGPGSGKSTLANYLASQISEQQAEQVVCLSMDGFHLSKQQLSALPNAEQAFTRRGAPWTFNSAAFIERVGKIREGFQQQDTLWPSFDHALGDPIENAICLSKNTKLVLIEGLYLLHQQDGWQGAQALFDEHWFLDIPLEKALERLAQRHIKAWGLSHAQAIQRINQNDRLNAKLVTSYKNQADWLLKI